MNAVWFLFAAVLSDHKRHLELVEPLPQHGHAKQAPGLLDDEVDGVGRHLLGSHHQVAFVFPLLIVYDDQQPAGSHFLEGFFQAAQRHIYTLLVRMGPRVTLLPVQ